jgi:hypothetical protein
MPLTDKDKEKEFNEAYRIAWQFWARWQSEAKRDMAFYLGDQWDSAQKKYLLEQRREALVFNKVHRVIKLVSGYQRKTRLSMRIDPVENGDVMTASQLSAAVQWNMTYADGYNIISDAFELGALATGLNLIGLYVDYSDDLVSGDIKFCRYAYNRFLIDPNCDDRAMQRGRFLLVRDYLEKEDMLSILPKSAASAVDGIRPGRDEKYSNYIPSKGMSGDDLFAFDRMWVRGRKPVKIMIDPQSGQQRVLDTAIPAEAMQMIQAYMPGVKVVTGYKEQSELRIFVQGRCVWSGPDPSGVQTGFPFVPVYGFFAPEEPDAALRVQGVVRCMRDPQTETNKRRSKILDVMDSQISSGWQAYEGTLVNPDVLYRSGQALVQWLKKDTTPDKVPSRIGAPDIPQGFFQAMEKLDNDVMEIPGANSELFGTPENDNIQTAGILAKLRSAQGLVVLQDLFDNLRLSQKHLGNKQVDIIQQSFKPDKVQRITGRPPAKEFYTRRFGKYDCVPTEGVLTDTQRQMHYTQLFGMKQAGAPIPWAAIIDAAPIEDKAQLMQMIQKEEQSQSQMAQMEQKLQMLQTMMSQAKIESDLANAEEQRSQSTQNRSAAVLDRIKTIKELQGMDADQVVKLAKVIKTLMMDPAILNQGNEGQEQQQPQQPPEQPAQPPIGNA